MDAWIRVLAEAGGVLGIILASVYAALRILRTDSGEKGLIEQLTEECQRLREENRQLRTGGD